MSAVLSKKAAFNFSGDLTVSKDPRAEHVALLLAPTGGNVVELAAAQDAAALNVIPAKAGIQGILVPRSTWESWTPAFAGVTAQARGQPFLRNLPAKPNRSDHVHSTWVSKAD